MAEFKVFSIKDTALEVFSHPFYHTHTQGALRGFQTEVNNPQSDMFRLANDMELWELGVFHDDEGKFELLPPRRVARGIDLKQPVDVPAPKLAKS